MLVVEHSEDGALGLVLNDPLDVDARGLLPFWDRYLAPPQRVFRGGPVQPEVAVALGRSPDGSTTLVDLDGPPGELAVVRLFSGYSGWGPLQLDAELGDGDWLLAPLGPDDAFTEDPEHLWRRVAARLDGGDALLATLPLDPRLN